MLHHRSYQSILPTHNKLLQQRWDSTYYEEHRRRIMTASHMVSTNAPKQHLHVVDKLKKQQRESERSEVVQRDNDTLMTHMSAIMERGSYVDHRNDYKHWSLNYEKRVNEMQRIQKENIKMLGRIQSRPANYKVSEWLKDRSEKERLISMITAHPGSRQTRSARPYADRERKAYSHSSLVPLQVDSGSLATLDPSESDTVESLERELEAARIQVDKCAIEKKIISEVKAMSNPPAPFIMVTEACAILFNRQRDKRDSSWRVGVTALAENYLISVDRNSFPLSVLKKLQFYIENPKLNEEALKCVSWCISFVWKWVESVYHYGVLAHKYGIRAEEMGIVPIVQQESMAAEHSPVVKEKKVKSFASLELCETDTVESLKLELEKARSEYSNCELKKNDLSELKSLSKPPAMVKLVLEACGIIFNQKGDNLWRLGLLSLSPANAGAIDLDNIPLSVLKKLRKYIENQDITDSSLKKVSLCIASVWKWVEIVYHYGVLAHKYGIRAEEMGIVPIVQQESMAAEHSPVVKEKKGKSFASLELSETDTVESLKLELEKAKSEFRNCGINKNDIVILKTMPKPPAMVKLVLEACGIIFNQKGDNLWRLGLLSLSPANAGAIDLDNISLSVLKKLRKYIENQDITDSSLKKVSLCIASVWKWVEIVYHYGILAHKYGIRAEEMGIVSIVQQEAMAAEHSPVVKEKKGKSFLSLELSETDTVESLKLELEKARSEFRNCGINKNDIVALKSMPKPPAMVKLVLEACGIIFNQKGDNLWRLGLISLSPANAGSIDLDNISLSVLKKLRKYIENQDITHPSLKTVSSSTVSVWKWVESVYHYGVLVHKLDQLSTNNFSKDTS